MRQHLVPIRKKTYDPVLGGSATGVLFICVGMLLGGLHLYNQNEHRKLLDTGIKAEATVVRVIKDDSGSGRKRHTAYYPVVRFTDTAGHEQLVEMTTDAGGSLKQGDLLNIVYTPGNPKKMALEQPLHTSGTLILAIAGGICVLAGLGIIGTNVHLNRKR